MADSEDDWENDSNPAPVVGGKNDDWEDDSPIVKPQPVAGDDDWSDDDADKKDDWDRENSPPQNEETTAEGWVKESPTTKARTNSEASSSGDTSPSKKKEHEKETLLLPSTDKNESEGNKKETLLPVDKSEGKKNSWSEFKIKNFKDVEEMINRFLRPKLYPEEGTEGAKKLTVKKAHTKVLNTFCDAKLAQLELNEMEKFGKELTKIIKAKKEQEEAAAKEKIRMEAKAADDAKKAEEERLAKEAAAKGEEYVNDEDFFAGLE